MSSSALSRPLALVLAALLTGLEGAFLCGYAALEALHVTSERATMGTTTALFFGLLGLALLACATGLYRLGSWARGPVVFTQLLVLGLAWSFRGDGTTWVSVVLLVVALTTLLGLFNPASMSALAEEPYDP